MDLLKHRSPGGCTRFRLGYRYRWTVCAGSRVSVPITVRPQHRDGIDALLVGTFLNGRQIRLRGGDQLRQIGDDLGYDAGDAHGKTDGNGDRSRNIDGRTRNAAPDTTGRSGVLIQRLNIQGLRTHNATGHYPGTGLAAACANSTASRGVSAYRGCDCRITARRAEAIATVTRMGGDRLRAPVGAAD